MEIAPGGGATKPEPQAGVSSFLFVVGGALTLTLDGEEHVLDEGGFAFVPPNAVWSLKNNESEIVTFHWIRKRYEALDYVPAPKAMGRHFSGRSLLNAPSTRLKEQPDRPKPMSTPAPM